jgi:glutaredoxin
MVVYPPLVDPPIAAARIAAVRKVQDRMPRPEQPQVVLYLRPTCAYCRQVYDLLMRRQVDLTVRDVSQDADALAEMVQRSGQHEVPVVVAGGEVIVGLDRRRLDQLFPREEEQPARLGVSIASVGAAGKRPLGAYVGRVSADSPADRAGLREGDVIVEVAQQPVRSAHDVHAALVQILPGTKVPVTMWRNGHRLRIIVNV